MEAGFDACFGSGARVSSGIDFADAPLAGPAALGAKRSSSQRRLLTTEPTTGSTRPFWPRRPSSTSDGTSPGMITVTRPP